MTPRVHHLTEVNELGGQFGNNWLESAARTQLASLAVRAGHLDEARALLVESVDASEDTELSTLTVTFSLVAYAQLALAEGDARRAAMALGAADGLRQRAGLRAWPLTRRGEAELRHPRGAGDRSRGLQRRLRGRLRAQSA